MYTYQKALIYILLLNGPSIIQAHIEQAVTYETTSGRFGDNLLSYMHAKWIAYKYRIPLLYRPFIYSDQLLIHTQERTKSSVSHYSKTIPLGKARSVKRTDGSTLYWVPYFPESKWELANCIAYSGGTWDYIDVDWNDKQFINELKQIIVPRTPITPLALPTNCITVALHIRRGGLYDPPQTVAACPLKFLPDEFFISQLKQLYKILDEQPLYVHIFTDDHNPNVMLTKFKNIFKHYAITFRCREHNNTENNNVIEDFFALQQFDCLIHSESNFSLTASKLGNYMISLYPDSFYQKNNTVIYDNVVITINSNHPKFKKNNN